MKRLRKKPPEQYRKALRARWKDEIFPAILLLHGPPPIPRGMSDIQARDLWHEQYVWESEVSDSYADAYLAEFQKGRQITNNHIMHFTNAFVDWCRRKR